MCKVKESRIAVVRVRVLRFVRMRLMRISYDAFLRLHIHTMGTWANVALEIAFALLLSGLCAVGSLSLDVCQKSCMLPVQQFFGGKSIRYDVEALQLLHLVAMMLDYVEYV